VKILITGCAGFIGSHVCEQLIKNSHTVIGIDNFDNFYDIEIKKTNLSWLIKQDNFKFYQIDITKTKELSELTETGVDVVVHLAAKAGVRPSIEKPLDYISVNITGTYNILNYMRTNNISKIVFASSSSVYGDSTPAPYKETATVDFPISPYAFTKKSGELLLYNFHHLYNFNTIMLRFFTVYGPRQRPDLAINKFFTAIENNEKIQVYGDGNTLRDYTYISDIVCGIIKSIELVSNSGPIYEIINLGNNKPTKLLDLIATIEKVVNKKALLEFIEMQAGDVKMTCADTSKALKLLNYTSSTLMEEGLKNYYAWRNKNV